MQISPRMKKILVVMSLIFIATTLTGCQVPRDAKGNILLIETTTTFGQMFANENWFSAIFVWPLSQGINYLTPYVGVGAAIAIVTIVLNAVLAVLTLKSTIAQQEMQLIQPELNRIQKKYEGRDDQASKMKMAQETQKLYAEHNINPFGTILVTFIQLPVIMAMYMAVQRAYSVQNGTFLGISLKISPWAGIKAAQWMYLFIFIVMVISQALSMFTPMLLSKIKAKKEAEKHHRRPEKNDSKSMIYMQIYMAGIIVFFGLTLPTAMAVYWIINSLVAISKTLIVNHYIENRKA